jgi:Flp pilus assembly protein TadG
VIPRRDERGQVIVLVAVILTVLLVCAALVFDVGSWFHAQRQLQSSVDSAALAGAQDLPLATGVVGPSNAQTTANTMVTTNTNNNPDNRSSNVAVTFPAPSGANCTTDNCLAVNGTRPTNGLLVGALNSLSVFGTVSVKAHAQAFLGAPTGLNFVSAAPVPVTRVCAEPNPPPCTEPTGTIQLTLDFAGSGGTVTPLLDLATHSATDQTITSNGVSTTDMNTWLQSGFPGDLPVNQWYAIDGGSHNGFKQAFQADAAIQKVIIIPVFDQQYPANPPSSGPTAYHVIGFAAFKVTGVNGWNNGAGHILTGQFVRYIGTGLTSGPCNNCENFGVFVVGLNG